MVQKVDTNGGVTLNVTTYTELSQKQLLKTSATLLCPTEPVDDANEPLRVTQPAGESPQVEKNLLAETQSPINVKLDVADFSNCDEDVSVSG